MKKFMKQYKKSRDSHGTDSSEDSRDSDEEGGAWVEEISSDEAPPPLIDIEKKVKRPVQKVHVDHPATIDKLGRRFDTELEVQEVIGSTKFDISKATSIKLSGNSYGLEACRWLAD